MSTMELEQVKSPDGLRRVGSKWTYVLTEEDKAAFEQGRIDFAEGRCMDHDEFMAELDQWFADKRRKN